jgi:hypothetical protein
LNRWIWIVTAAAALMSGCATSRYQWGNYDEALYRSYKDPAQVENLRTSLESHITALETTKSKVAPGLYAELGTLYLQSGQQQRAIALYTKERQAWPESAVLMDAMIRGIERRASAQVKP